MPVFNRFYVKKAPPNSLAHPQHLMLSGPRLDVEVHVPTAFEGLLVREGKPIPKPIVGKALIDTGASITAVDDSVITSLGVQAVGVATVLTPAGQTQRNQYPVRFIFPGSPLPNLDIHQAIGGELLGQGFVALIGRDALSSVVFIYNGPGGMITFAL
jgi:hypothetical protein